MAEQKPAADRIKQLRLVLWLLVAVAVAAMLAILLIPRTHAADDHAQSTQSRFGGPFTLVGGDGRPFSSAELKGKPYAIYFGFTRCGDTCPTTLSRLAKLRQQAGGANAFNIVFVTIDPAHDGPREVGQYAALFDTPIIGLTGSPQQIEDVKRHYGIFAQAMPDAPAGEEMEHTSTVLLFDRSGGLAGTISPSESDASALQTLKGLV